MEWEAVPKAGYSISPITVAGLPRSLSPKLLTFPFKLGKGFSDAWKLVKGFDADVVVGTGGFVTGPVLGAAQAMGRPTLIQEQNAFAGLTNRLLSKRASEIHVAFPEASKAFAGADVQLSGNPTREILQSGDRAAGRTHYDIPESATVLLMFGGSLGSRRLNDAMIEHAPTLLDANPDLHIVWQTGSYYYSEMLDEAPDHDRLHVLEYLDEMQHAYAAADVVLCRAGAITCCELAITQIARDPGAVAQRVRRPPDAQRAQPGARRSRHPASRSRPRRPTRARRAGAHRRRRQARVDENGAGHAGPPRSRSRHRPARAGSGWCACF